MSNFHLSRLTTSLYWVLIARTTGFSLLLLMLLLLNQGVSTAHPTFQVPTPLPGIHMGNHNPNGVWERQLFHWIDPSRFTPAAWPEVVVFLSDQVYDISRFNCRITTNTRARPTAVEIINYLKTLSLQHPSTKIIIRIHPSPGNIDENGNILASEVPPDWCN